MFEILSSFHGCHFHWALSAVELCRDHNKSLSFQIFVICLFLRYQTDVHRPNLEFEFQTDVNCLWFGYRLRPWVKEIINCYRLKWVIVNNNNWLLYLCKCDSGNMTDVRFHNFAFALYVTCIVGWCFEEWTRTWMLCDYLGKSSGFHHLIICQMGEMTPALTQVKLKELRCQQCWYFWLLRIEKNKAPDHFTVRTYYTLRNIK
jgi:hypothetical protein